MKRVLILLVVGCISFGVSGSVHAEEDGKGSMKGSAAEHKSDSNKGVLQGVMKEYISSHSGEDGFLELEDPKTGKVRKLLFMGLHDKVGTKNGKHYSCADFQDQDTGEVLDVDLYVDVSGDVKVTGVVIHKVEGDPVDGEEAKGSVKGSMKGSGSE